MTWYVILAVLCVIIAYGVGALIELARAKWPVSGEEENEQ